MAAALDPDRPLLHHALFDDDGTTRAGGVQGGALAGGRRETGFEGVGGLAGTTLDIDLAGGRVGDGLAFVR